VTGEVWGEEPPVVQIGAWAGRVVPGGLDDLGRDGVVALRSVRVVVRDHDWCTVPVVDQQLHQGGRELRLTFRAEDSTAQVDGELALRDVAGVLVCDARVTARSAFRRNRIGIVVLQTADLAGASFRNGDEHLEFPTRISPHQPARRIRDLSWVSQGWAHRVEFEGDEFEMEDQRNWTDASYKTYSTPLAVPFPVDVAPGDIIRQSVRVSSFPMTDAPVAPAGDRLEIALDLERRSREMPRIAIGAATAPDMEAPPDLPPLPADAVLVELRAMDGNWRAALERARRDAAGLPLDVRVIARDSNDVARVVDALRPAEVERLAVYDVFSHVTEPALWRALQEASSAQGFSALAGGTRAHFTELNRTLERIDLGLPAVTFSITPQMHDRSTRQIAESVHMQRLVARDAAVLAAGRPVHVGPVTLRPRENFVATSALRVDREVDLRSGYGPAHDASTSDSRQDASELEAWTIASATALASEGVASIAYFEAWGPRGIRREGRDSPGWRALERLAPFRRASRVAAVFSDGIGVLGRQEGADLRFLVSSVRPMPADVSILVADRHAKVSLKAFEALDVDLYVRSTSISSPRLAQRPRARP
jgi:hypothetical protein